MPVEDALTSPLRWVVTGLGDIALRRVLPAIQSDPRSTLYGVVTRDPVKGRLHAPRVWTSLDDSLADPGVDAVYVATPVALHAPLSIAALRAGRHVLCEKPMAMNYPEALAMVGEARRARGRFGVAYYRRFYPKILRARELIRSGAIGRPVLAELWCHNWFAAEDGFRSWLVDPALAGGGPLYDIASHRIDLLNFLFGEPRRVSAQLSNTVHRYAVEDAATLLIEYDAGVRGLCDVRWHSRVHRDECRIIGADGALDLAPLNDPRVVTPARVEDLPLPENPHLPLIANFVAAALDGAELVSSGETALLTDAVTAAAIESSRACAPIAPAPPDLPAGFPPGS